MVVSLCRCGQSKHKPYFDGTHTDIDLQVCGELFKKNLYPLS